jgi:radical SAM protein with 4Fe4S-binding SPASM domain
MFFEELFKKKQRTEHGWSRKDFLLKESKHFCMLPWTALQVRPDGKVYPCCVAEEKSHLGNAKKQSLKDIWNSPRLRKIRRKMLRDEYVQECSYCYKLGESTPGSFRKKFNRDFAPHFERLVPGTSSRGEVKNMKLLYWDYRLSNLCNFKCRSCSHMASSSWYQDTLKLYGGSALPQAVHNVVDYRPEIVNELLEHLPYVEEIYFAGGEPLIMEEHYQILEALRKAQRTDVKIWYNTNFSTLKAAGRDVVEFWRDFENVTVQASLDGSYRRGEYLRKGQHWGRTVKNRERMLKECPHVKFEISATTSSYNVWHLPDFFKEWRELGFIGANDFFFNPLFGPDHMKVQLLPRFFREEVVEKYRNICGETVNTRHMEIRFDKVTKWILSSDEERLIPEFHKVTAQMDRMRGENYVEVFPELSFMKGH